MVTRGTVHIHRRPSPTNRSLHYLHTAGEPQEGRDALAAPAPPEGTLLPRLRAAPESRQREAEVAPGRSRERPGVSGGGFESDRRRH